MVTMRKRSPDGTIRISYPARIVGGNWNYTLLGARWTHDGDFDGFAMRAGDPVLEYFYRNMWYGVIRLMDRRGHLVGWYCDLCTPPEIEMIGGQMTLSYTDLALDVFVDAAGKPRVRDTAEFEDRVLPRLDPRARQESHRALAHLFRAIRTSTGPFAPGRGVTLEDLLSQLYEPAFP